MEDGGRHSRASLSDAGVGVARCNVRPYACGARTGITTLVPEEEDGPSTVMKKQSCNMKRTMIKPEIERKTGCAATIDETTRLRHTQQMGEDSDLPPVQNPPGKHREQRSKGGSLPTISRDWQFTPKQRNSRTRTSGSLRSNTSASASAAFQFLLFLFQARLQNASRSKPYVQR